MTWAEITPWLQIATGVISVIVSIHLAILAAIFRGISAARKDAAAVAERIHERIDAIPEQVVSRREFEVQIKSHETQLQLLSDSIKDLSRAITAMSDQFDHFQFENADGRIELLRHQLDCPALSNAKHSVKAAPTRHRAEDFR